MSFQTQQQVKIKILNTVQNYIQNHDWVNYDNFAEDFTDEIIEKFEDENFDLKQILEGVKGSFLHLNHITNEKFLNDTFVNLLVKSLNKAKKYSVPVCRFSDIFPKIKKIPTDQIVEIAKKLDIQESIIQTALRDGLKDKDASPITQRGKDSSLEVADIEHFDLDIRGSSYSFSVVVKGYNSISGKLRWKDIAHQVTKADRTRPDYILVISAREPVDGLVSELKSYSKNIGNENHTIFVTPIELAKFLRCKAIV